MIRNLLFYCYPVRETIWPWHVDRLLERKSIWNGRRIIVLALDGRTDLESDVRARFEPVEAEILVRKNDPSLGEKAHFIDTLSLLKSTRSDEATFYAHAKGVTRKGPELEAVRSWSSLMYRCCLDFPALIERRLGQFATVGCLRWNHHYHSRTGWCWAGTFFWVRHDALFSRNWKDIDQSKYGVEDYPGRHFKIDEGSCLTMEHVEPVQLYTGTINEQFIKNAAAMLAEEEKLCIPAS